MQSAADDRFAIIAVLDRYSECLDARDWPGVADVFTDDAEDVRIAAKALDNEMSDSDFDEDTVDTPDPDDDPDPGGCYPTGEMDIVTPQEFTASAGEARSGGPGGLGGPGGSGGAAGGRS